MIENLYLKEGIWLTSESSERKIGKNETLCGFSFGQSKKAGQDVKGIVAEYSTWRTINKKESKGGTAPKTSSKSKTTTSNAATAMLTILEKTSRACAPKIANAFQVKIAFFSIGQSPFLLCCCFGYFLPAEIEILVLFMEHRVNYCLFNYIITKEK